MFPDLLAPNALSVSELNEIASNLLDSQLTGLWIGGEITNLTRAASGHHYFALKDPNAQVRCALFKHAAARLDAPLREGAHIEIRGKISIYAARGEFQITVQEVRQIGAGLLHFQFEQLKNRLQNEGLFDPNRKKTLPEIPQKIGIVTSLAAAALRDVVSTLKRRAPQCEIIVYPTAVQGAGSSQQIAQAIEKANIRQEVDVLIVCRGGGSLEDLWAFNEENTVRAVSGSQIPIISGVGHETDFTLCDLAADLRAPTPTAAAEMVCVSREELLRQINQLQHNLHRQLQQKYHNASQMLDFASQNLKHPKHIQQQKRQTLLATQQQFQLAMRQIVQKNTHLLAQYQQNWQQNRPNLRFYREKLRLLEQHFQPALQRKIQQKHKDLQNAAAQLESVSPLAVMTRGFAIIHDSKGNVVRDSQNVRTGQKLNVRWQNGTRKVQVIDDIQEDLFD